MGAESPTITVFMEAVSFGVRGFISDWYEKELGWEAQEEFHGLIGLLAVTPRELWIRRDFCPMEDGICELRFFADGKQYRPLGWFGPQPNQFTMLIGAYKKQRVWKPQDAKKTAKARRRDILEGRRKVRRYDKHKFSDVR